MIELIITYAAIAFFIWSLPMIYTQILIANLKRKQEGFFNGIRHVVMEISSCYKCTAFWVTLILSQNFILSCEVALLAFVIMSIQSNLKA